MQAETEALFNRKSIRRALKDWRRVQALGRHPLAYLQITARRRREAGYADTPGGRGVALQDLLRTGIDSLRPDSGEADPLAKSWRAYLSLNEQYVHGRSPAYAAALLGVARRTYYDEQTAALDCLGDWLRQQEQRVAASPGRKSGATIGAGDIPFMAPPPPPQPLVGRAALLDDLKQRLLNSNTSPRLALCGLPGVGKSSLANALAHHPALRRRFEDGVLWVGLGWQPDLLALLGRWGQALGLSADELAGQKSIADRVQMLHNFIGLRRMLLVIDDAWQAEAALTFVLGGPNCAHLITTRQPEVALQSAENDVIDIDELDLQAGVALLTRLAPQAMQAEPSAAEALVRMVGGLPLGLTLMGKYLLRESRSGQPRRLRAALNRLRQAEARLRLAQPQPPLTAQPSLAAKTPLSLQTAIGISDAVLDLSARRALYALSLFPPKPNTFSEAAALATAQPSGESSLSPAALDRLVDAGLLETGGPERCTLHQTIADYARAKLQNSGARRAACSQMAAFYTRFVSASKGDNAAIDPEINNLLAALEATHKQGLNVALTQLANALYPYLESRGLYAVAKTWARRAQQAAAETGDLTARITANRHWGSALLFLGDHEKAESVLQEGLVWAREFGDEKQIAAHLLSLGAVGLHRGDYAQAEARWQESLTLAYQLEDNALIADILINLGSLYVRRGEFAPARSTLQEAATLARATGDKLKLGGALTSLGAVESYLGNYDQADACYQEGLSLARELQHRERIAGFLINLGSLMLKRSAYRQARSYFLEALQLARQTGYQSLMAVVLVNLGTAAHYLGDSGQALVYYEEGLTLARAIGRREAVIFLLLNLGEIAGIRGDYRQAKTYLREGLALAQEIGHQRAEIAARQYLGVVAYQQGEDAPAAAYFGDGLRLAREIGYQEKISALLLHRGALALEQGQTAQAERQLQEGLALARKLAHAELICLALRYLSDAAVHRKAYKQARQYLEEGLTLARESGFSLSIIGMLQAWGRYHLAQAEWEAAAGVFTELLNLAQKAEAQGAVALALYGLARVNAAQGKGEQARLQEKESAAILTRIGHRRARFKRCTGD